jgi:hypothetical protein
MLCLLLCALTAACSPQATPMAEPTATPSPVRPTPTPVPQPVARAGRWAGEVISFEVTAGKYIRNLELTTHLSSGSTCVLFSERDIAIEEDGSFLLYATYEGASAQAGGVNRIQGAFTTDHAASGSYGPSIVCGDEMMFWIRELEWTAEWKGP